MNKEEIDLLEIVFTLAIGECAYNDINNIQKLEYKIKTIVNLCKKQKEVIDRIEKYIEKETRIYGLSMSIELGTHFDNILGILKEVE